MDKFKVLEIKKSVFSGNEKRADELRKQLKEKKLFILNLMSYICDCKKESRRKGG